MPIYHKPRTFAWIDTETTGVEEGSIPIEIACIVTDERLRLQTEYQSLILPPPWVMTTFANEGHWTPAAQEAFEVHKIEWRDVLLEGRPPRLVVGALLQRLKEHAHPGERPILVSDNPVFDHRMLRTLFALANLEQYWPFHYSAHSPVMLWTASGSHKPKREHRALADVRSWISQTEEAVKLVNLRGVYEIDFSAVESKTEEE